MADLSGRNWKVLVGDVRERLADLETDSVHCVCTSPPYWGLRDYQVDGQIGSEQTLQDFVAVMVDVFEDVRRVLRPDGVCWLNLGDTYNAYNHNRGSSTSISGINEHKHHSAAARGLSEPSLKPKDLCMVPARVAIALQDAGWWLRSEIIWAKPNPMPESTTDRPTKSHEMIYMLTKQPRYFYDDFAVRQSVTGNAHSKGGAFVNPKSKQNKPGSGVRQNESWAAAVNGFVDSRQLRTVWKIATQSYSGAHFATFPEKLPETCIKAATSEKGCCPDCGAPWRRLVEKERVRTRPGAKTKIKTPGRNSRVFVDRDPQHSSDRKVRDDYRDTSEIGNRDDGRHVTEMKHSGWEPTCECGHDETVPCTVLDPFSGSGTTGKVAVELGRRYIGIELNPEYAELSRDRITNPKKYAAPNVQKIDSLDGQLALFGD